MNIVMYLFIFMYAHAQALPNFRAPWRAYEKRLFTYKYIYESIYTYISIDIIIVIVNIVYSVV